MLARTDTTFDYGSLSAEKAASARAAAERIRGRMQLAAESIIEVGRELIEQKKALGHGNFLPWIETEFAMSAETARKYMRVTTELGSKFQPSWNLPVSALYALSAPSTPEPARAEVLDRAANGEKVTAKEIEALKRRAEKAEQLAETKESQRAAQESLANISAKQARTAETRAMFAEADKTRLAEELEQARDELSRLNDDGTIHIIREPAAPAKIPSLLMQAFDIASDEEVLELLIEREARIQALSRAAA